MPLSAIKQTLASGIERAIERTTGLPVASFAYMPTGLGVLFENLPVVLVDDDFATPDVWDQGSDQRGAYRTYLEIQLFCGLDVSDNGAASDALIHQMKEEAETYMVGVLQDGLPARGVIETSQVVGTPVETEDTGIVMRYAWFRVAMTIRP